MVVRGLSDSEIMYLFKSYSLGKSQELIASNLQISRYQVEKVLNTSYKYRDQIITAYGLPTWQSIETRLNFTTNQKYDDNMRDKVNNLRASGLTLKQISTELGVPFNSVRYILTRG